MSEPITIFRSTHSALDDPTWHVTYAHPELCNPWVVRFVKMGRNGCLLRSYGEWTGDSWSPRRWMPKQPVVPRWLLQKVEDTLRQRKEATP